MKTDELEKIELEGGDNDATGDSSLGGGPRDSGDPGDGLSDRTGGDGRGNESDGGASGGASGDSGADGGDGVSSSGDSGSTIVSDSGTGGDDAVRIPELASSGTDGGGRRKRGRPRLDRSGGSGAPDNRATGTGDESGKRGLDKENTVRVKNGEPKTVKAPELEDPEISKLTKNEVVEILAGVLQGIFFVPANALNQGHWQINDREAVELANAVYGVIKTLPKNQSKKVDKFLKEYAPLVKFVMVAGSITYPRILVSVELAKQQKEAQTLEFNAHRPGTNGNGPAITSVDFGSGYGTAN
jgi:hypothetical protein